MKNMDSKHSVQKLGETIHSLLGLKAHLTSSWVKSVCDIVKNLPSERSSTNIKRKILERQCSAEIKEVDSESTVSETKDELATLSAYINQLNIQRRQILNEFLDLKGNIRVFCRIRPIRIGENFGCLRPVIASDSGNVLLKLADKKSKSYSFDKVFHPGSSQDEVFSEVEPVIKSVLDGYNACIFAYGQTGTGKTFTMEGAPDSPGIVPRAIEALFKQAVESNHAFRISFSMLEIYLGNLKDLLVTHPTKATDPLPPCLSIHTDPKGGIEIDNLVTIQVSDFNQAFRLYRLGCRFRSTASTNSNTTSSRSHCMIRISITCFDAPERQRETNKIWLVDLGGSERVLKTKSWGRRFDEGKAINLSLSALGDVINALQRRKRHVPFRNSKLTQVLKDSLGEDSKTLMLVHVSPKEDDLCETICSLNFATRVKSIHLGHEDSNEVRDQKEFSMKNLQQKMKKIEEERVRVRGEIENLNQKLKAQTRPAHSFQERIEVSQSSAEEPLSNLGNKKNKIGDATAAPLSQLPRFMRPTFCSRRKSGIDLYNSEGKDQAIRRRRRPSSHRAESVTLPVKINSEYNSEHSISRSSCLADLNMKNSADYETEYSQETLDCDINIVALPEQDRTQISIRQRVPLNYLEKCASQKNEKFNSKKFSKVDDWLLYKNESTVPGFTDRSQRVPAIPVPGNKHRGREPSTAQTLCNDKVPVYEFTEENTVIHNKRKQRLDVEGVELPIPEVITEKPLPMLKDLFEMDSMLDSISSSHIPVGKKMLQMQDFGDSSSIDDNTSSSPSLPDMNCGTLNQYTDDDELYTMSMMQLLQGEIHCSESMLKNGGCAFSPSESDNSIIESKGDSGVSESIYSHCEQVSTETGTEDNEKKELDACFLPFPMETRPSPLTLRSQRALFMNEANQKDLNMPYNISQGSTQSEGTCYVLKQNVQIFLSSTLLGLGFYDLGFDHDFFHGLML